MVQRQVFSAGFKPLASDFTAIGLNRQAAFKLLLSAFSQDASAVLFDATAPTVSENGTEFTISTPSQRVSVEGALAESALYEETFDVDNGAGGENDLYVSVFFVVRETPVSDTRNFLTTVPATGAQILQNLTAEIAQQYTVDVVYLSSAVNGDTQEPVLGTDDVGSVKLAEFWRPGGGSATVTVNDVAKFALPAGTAATIAPHASEHLPGGTDPIQLAALDSNDPNGSTVGLMPAGSLSAALGSVQGIIAAQDSTFLSFATQADDSGFGTQVIADLETDNSLTAYPGTSNTQLGLNFLAPGSLRGQSSRPARSDHTHPLSETGMLVLNQTRNLSLSDRGEVLTIPVTTPNSTIEIEQITDVTVYWEPNNVADGQYVRIAAPWSVAGNGDQTVGARATVTGTNTFLLELGTEGITYLTTAMQDAIDPLLSTGYVGNNYPTDGTLHMVITAIRKGTNG